MAAKFTRIVREGMKEIILNRLYKTSSICGHCGSKDCEHEGNRKLTETIHAADVIKAINLDEYFFKEG
jgi:hypothetical protein